MEGEGVMGRALESWLAVARASAFGAPADDLAFDFNAPAPAAAPASVPSFGEVDFGGGAPSPGSGGGDLEFDPTASPRKAADDLEADLGGRGGEQLDARDVGHQLLHEGDVGRVVLDIDDDVLAMQAGELRGVALVRGLGRLGLAGDGGTAHADGALVRNQQEAQKAAQRGSTESGR